MLQVRRRYSLKEQEYKDIVIDTHNSGRLGIIQTQFELGLYPFINFPRTEAYEVARNIPLPSINQAEFNTTIDRFDFRRQWVIQFTDNTGLEKLIVHSNGYKNYHDFTEVTRLPNGTFSYSVLRFDAGTIKIATNLGNEIELLETFYWLVRLFHAKHIRGYLHVKGGNSKHKPRGIGGFGNISCKISLSAKGKKYHYPPKQTQNPNYKNGKAEVDIEVSPFRRRVRWGKGRVNIEWRNIDAFHRKQWIVPRDKVTKIAA
jgi:hypothetical protein